jgi:two-component system response regulator MprA
MSVGAEEARPILVAEDDAAIRSLVQWALEDEGFVIDVVADGAAAIDYLAARRPRLVVLDMMMPRADGHQVAEALRSIHGSDVPLLVVTAAGDAREATRRVGAERGLAKPFDIAELITSVRQLLGQRQLSLVERYDADEERFLDAASGG